MNFSGWIQPHRAARQPAGDMVILLPWSYRPLTVLLPSSYRANPFLFLAHTLLLALAFILPASSVVRVEEFAFLALSPAPAPGAGVAVQIDTPHNALSGRAAVRLETLLSDKLSACQGNNH